MENDDLQWKGSEQGHGMCQGTPAVVPTRVSIRTSALNKGSSGDPGTWSIIGHAHARTGGIWYIYQGPQQMLSADCDAFGLTVIRGAKVLGSSLYKMGNDLKDDQR
jgi:hypothetical protein